MWQKKQLKEVLDQSKSKEKKMSKTMLSQKLNSLQSLPKRLKKNEDMSFVWNYP